MATTRRRLRLLAQHHAGLAARGLAARLSRDRPEEPSLLRPRGQQDRLRRACSPPRRPMPRRMVTPERMGERWDQAEAAMDALRDRIRGGPAGRADRRRRRPDGALPHHQQPDLRDLLRQDDPQCQDASSRTATAGTRRRAWRARSRAPTASTRCRRHGAVADPRSCATATSTSPRWTAWSAASSRATRSRSSTGATCRAPACR